MLKSKHLTILFITMIVLGANVAFATTQNYKVKYDESESTVKGPSLKNATLVLHFYAGGSPVGKQSVTTDEQQAFSLENRYGKRFVIDVVSIKGSPKSIRCHGTVHGHQTTIQLVCHKRPEKHY